MVVVLASNLPHMYIHKEVPDKKVANFCSYDFGLYYVGCSSSNCG